MKTKLILLVTLITSLAFGHEGVDLAEDIRQRKPAVRITISRIGRELGVLNILRKKLSLLPAVAGVLASSLETIEAFQLRRIQNVLDKYNRAQPKRFDEGCWATSSESEANGFAGHRQPVQ